MTDPTQLLNNTLNLRRQDVIARRTGKTHTSNAYGSCPAGYVRLFDPKVLDAFIDTEADRDAARRNESLIKKLRELGPYRILSRIDDSTMNRLTKLKDRFENFDTVIGAYQRAALVAKIGGQAMRQTPIIIVGPPGCGKTEFIGELALAMNTPVECLHMVYRLAFPGHGFATQAAFRMA